MIKIITDSAADIPKNEVDALGIQVLAIPITVDGVTYMEGEDFTSEEYYKMLVAAKELPTTSQITALRYAEAFDKAVKEGYNHIICVTITSKGSGIFNAANLAKRMILEEQPALCENVTIDIVDSRTYTYVYGLAVVAAAKAVKAGKSRNEVLDVLNDHLTNYHVYVGLFNLDYAKKSGRITSAAAFVGEIMGFRPILTLVDGALETHSKVRGDHKLIEALCQLCKEDYVNDGRPFYIIRADSKENAHTLEKMVAKQTGLKCAGTYLMGGSIVTNSGPTIIGVVYPVAKK
ncbi:MAG: DegV family protein [Angelakisella sp.]|nr:DegV family protein [Angelakisella sp.]